MRPHADWRTLRRVVAQLASEVPPDAIVLTAEELAIATTWARWISMAGHAVHARELLRAINRARWRPAPTVEQVDAYGAPPEQMAVGDEPVDPWQELGPSWGGDYRATGPSTSKSGRKKVGTAPPAIRS